jgi:hypothetical protein
MATMKIKKAKKVTTPPTHDYKVRFGTRNQLGPEHQFATEPAARQGIINEFNSWKPWCLRYNNAGVDAIKAACDLVGSVTFHRDPSRLECIFDEHTGMHVCAEFWTTR